MTDRACRWNTCGINRCTLLERAHVECLLLKADAGQMFANKGELIATSRKRPSAHDFDYQALAEFRYRIRIYLRYMEQQCRKAGLTHQQYQLILAIKGLPPGVEASIRVLAERMQLNHNSLVELADRAAEATLVRRVNARTDQRKVCLVLSTKGERILGTLVEAAREELRVLGPDLIQSISSLAPSGRG